MTKLKHKRIVKNRKNSVQKKGLCRLAKDERGEILVIAFASRRSGTISLDELDVDREFERHGFSSGILRAILTAMSPEEALIRSQEDRDDD